MHGAERLCSDNSNYPEGFKAAISFPRSLAEVKISRPANPSLPDSPRMAIDRAAPAACRESDRKQAVDAMGTSGELPWLRGLNRATSVA